MTRVLVMSVILTVVVIGGAWMVSALRAGPMPQSTQAAVSAAALAPNALKSQAWDQAHLGADGLKKCTAFRQVLRHTNQLGHAGRGRMPPSARTQLDTELDAARAMPPVALTPLQCGVPLG
jgi:hypothetical protein